MKDGVYWCRKGVFCATISNTIPQFIYQQDGAQPNFHHDTLLHRWIGCASLNDFPLLPWPPRSPDLTPCEFFLWGYVKDYVFVPPCP